MNPRTWAARVGWAATAAVAARGITGVTNTVSSLAWLRSRDPEPGGEDGDADPPHFALIVPALREQPVLPGTVAHLSEIARRNGRASVVVVTTEREFHEPDPWRHGDPARPNTVELARDLAAGHQDGPVRHTHFPDPTGVMVDQVNYAARAEINRLTERGVDPSRVWVAVYNADSQPDPDTLDAVTTLAAREDVRIVQQSALFTSNLPVFPSGPCGAILAGAALLQSRWTLAREIPRLRRQARRTRCGARWPSLAHCVGHGLFIRADAYLAAGGLPIEPMNEDLAFGYLACAAGIPIDPLPLLEHAESPSTVSGWIRQTRQWFWSYTEYPLFARMAANARLGDQRSRMWLAAQGLARGGLWLAQSSAVTIALGLPVVAYRRGPALVAALTAVCAYAVVPAALLAAHERHAGTRIPFGPREAVGGIAAAVISSAGPWWCAANAARRRLTHTTYPHDKTERRT